MMEFELLLTNKSWLYERSRRFAEFSYRTWVCVCTRTRIWIWICKSASCLWEKHWFQPNFLTWQNFLHSPVRVGETEEKSSANRSPNWWRSWKGKKAGITEEADKTQVAESRQIWSATLGCDAVSSEDEHTFSSFLSDVKRCSKPTAPPGFSRNYRCSGLLVICLAKSDC